MLFRSESPMIFRSPRVKPDDLAKMTTLRQAGRGTPADSPIFSEPSNLLEFTNAHESRLLELPPEAMSCSDTREETNIDDRSQQECIMPECTDSLIVSAEAFSCSACHKFLYRPVVLNCGEGKA